MLYVVSIGFHVVSFTQAKSLTPRSSLAPSETVSERVKDSTLGRKPSRGVSGMWSSKTGATGVSAATNSTAAAKKKIRGEKLIEEEKAAIGGVKWGVYYGYAKSIGLAFTIMSISMYAIYQVERMHLSNVLLLLL